MYCCFDAQLAEMEINGRYIALCGRMHEKDEKILKSLVQEKPVPILLSAQYVKHGLAWDKNRTSAV